MAQDRYGNVIYFTQERWEHILESRPEVEPYLDLFLDTLRTGRRQQDPLIANEYVANNFVTPRWANYIWSQG